MESTQHLEDRLTARELMVLRLVARGLSNRAIGQKLSITLKTVECHLTHIFEKLQVKTRTQAALWIVQHEGSQSENFGVSPDAETRLDLLPWHRMSTRSSERT